MRQLVRKIYYLVTGKETKWDMEFDSKKYNWKKLRLPQKRKDLFKKLLGVEK